MRLKVADSWELCDGKVSPIGFPYSNPFLGHLLDVKYRDRQMFDLAKYRHYIPIVLVAYVS